MPPQILNDLENISITYRNYVSDSLNGLRKLTDERPMEYNNQKEAELLERCVLFEVETIWRNLNASLLNVSDDLSQAGRTLTKFYNQNGTKYKTKFAFQYLSYTFKRKPGKSVGPYARVLSKHWWEKKSILEHLSNHLLSELGVGVWCSSTAVIISIVRY